MIPETASITALVPYFGGKRSMAQAIVEELGKHAAYWEPFCGSMATLMAKPVSAHETVCDLYGDLTNLAMVVASDACAVLYDRLVRTLCNEALFLAAKERVAEDWENVPASPREVQDVHVERAYWYFVAAWVGRSGCAGTRRVNYQMAVRWTPGGGAGGVRFASATDSLPWFHQRLRNVLILRRSAFDVLPRIEDLPTVAIYADPPYLMNTRGAGRKSGPGGGGSNYLYDFKAEDHVRLAEELRRFKKARVVVSYYADPALEELYPGWTVVDHCRQKNLHVQNRRGAGLCEAPEVLLLNGPSYAKREGLFA